MEDWLAALIGAIIGAVFGFIASWLTLRFNYHQLFAQTVSSNRMDWINVWRENIAKLLACAEVLHSKKPSDHCKCEKEFFEARAMIIIRLNPKEPKHVLMNKLLENFDYKINNKNFNTQKEAIIELAQSILKPEWERVKKEAKGEKI